MRILFLSPYVPFPIRHGGHNRTLTLIRGLSRLGAVHVLAVGDPRDALEDARRQFREWGVDLEVHAATGPGPAERDADDLDRVPDAASHFRSPTLSAAITAYVEKAPPDVVHFEELVMAPYADLVPGPRVIDRQKVEWQTLAALAADGGPDADRDRREAERFRRWEGRAAAAFADVLVPSAADAALLAGHFPAGALHVVPIVVGDALTPGPRPAAVRHVLLYGSLDYAPNVLGLRFYFDRVWPLLSAAMPSLETHIVGSGTLPPGVVPAGDPRVRTLGYVADATSFLRAAGVLLVPLRVGGGVRTKVLEAMACGMPVVSTAVGVAGLGLTPGRHHLEAESPEEMVAAIVALAGDPERARSLGIEGARLVDGSFRQATVDRLVEIIYRPRVPAARGGGRRALLVGVRPLAGETGARQLSFAGHRTSHFRQAVELAGFDVECVLLDEEGSGAPTGVTALDAAAFRAGRVLQRRHDDVSPEIVVSAGGYHAARAVAGLVTTRPRWIDLAGDLAAEGQLRASHGGSADEHLAVLRAALAVGDRFSVVGESQRLALLGQLGLAGRLGAVGDEPVEVVPVAAAGPESAAPLPVNGFRVLWAGGYNTWMDEETLFRGLESAMNRRDDLTFVSTGGEVPDHEGAAHRRFWAWVSASKHASRFEDRGRVSRLEALRALGESHVVVSVSRACLEAELGSRQRVIEGAAHGRPVVLTDIGDVARQIRENGGGRVVAAAEPESLARALVDLAEDREALAACARAARRLWETRWTPEIATSALTRWARRPLAGPAPRPDPLAAHVLRLESELAAIRSSRTFRALRLVDRVLGRAQGGGR